MELNYDSVMIDGSRLSLEENIKITRAVAKIGHSQGISAEVELGAVMGYEKGLLSPYEELFRSGEGFTNVGEAERFVEETSVDWLSIVIGNIQGAISGVTKDKRKSKPDLILVIYKGFQKGLKYLLFSMLVPE